MSTIPNLSALRSEVQNNTPSKRRSLLYQFGRKTPLDTIEVGNVAADNVRVDSSRLSNEAQAMYETTGRDALDETRPVRATMSPSKLARPVSMAPPRASSNKTSKTRSHPPMTVNETNGGGGIEAARAQTLAALMGEPASTELPRSGSTMLPPPPRSLGPSVPSRTTSMRLASDSTSRRAAKIPGIQHASVIAITEPAPRSHRRQGSTTSATTSSGPVAASYNASSRSSRISSITGTGEASHKTSPPRASLLSKPRPSSQTLPPSAKPTFSMYQQHYSPAKSALPKPPLPSIKTGSKASTTPEEDAPLSLDEMKQQIELLQLSMLHQSSTICTAEYTASAKRKLSKIHSRLCKEYEQLRAMELVQQRAANLSALDGWCSDTGLLVENLQILSLVYSDLTSLMEDHSDVASMFELWMNEAETPHLRVFLEPLSEDWKSAHASLALKLRGIQRNLRVLPPVPKASHSSGVAIVWKACTALVQDMLDELDVMSRLEKEIMAREDMKVDDEINELVRNDSRLGGKENWTPPWQVAT